ncbi:MAG: exodeoxyribonuclease VII large subunit, partial [Propionibacteriaceae bacterium]|nr:exodeoxyribonuclease VII large subunit [Propionibacteriaceae bacterium]
SIQEQEKERIDALLARIQALSPKATLSRGYAILTKSDITITSSGQIDPGDQLLGYLHDGRITLDVISKESK